MERPSHIIFDTHQSLSRRLPLLGLAASLQIAIFWLFTHGLVSQVIQPFIHNIDLVPFKEKVDTGPKPPPIDVQIQKKVELPTVALPIFNTGRDAGSTAITATPANATTTQSAGADRAPVSIAATHTVPPYPVIARRVGWEGKVTLRLTVLTDGGVGAAEVVTSSGRVDLDQTAQAWIVSPWRYRPALDKGAPAVSQTLATVVFSLKDTP
ncbi:MAG TPA: energy transducer TonB [Rhizomicrobium sp.]|nr:energy transducer TonB [Rhizomicrobium sp.]